MRKQIRLKVTARMLSAVTLFLMTITALGHDYWLEPEQFFAAQNSSIKVHLYVGEDWNREEERVLQKERTIRFQMLSSAGSQDLIVAGREGQIPIANVKVSQAGNYLIALERNWSTIKLDAKKFTDYLKEEGLNSIIVQRAQRGESQTEGRERYSRYLKSLIQVGDRHDDNYKRVLGQHLEIIPDVNPYEMKAGDSLRVRVYFEGKPLAGAKVFASNRSGGNIREQSAETSSEGLVRFTLDRAGEWMLHMVHMRRCEGCAEADWESFWAAYTFGLK